MGGDDYFHPSLPGRFEPSGDLKVDYSFTRYLAAKKTIDDRSLNHEVWRALRGGVPAGPLLILEVGAGTGTMVERLASRGLRWANGGYTAIDADTENIAEARRRLDAIDLPGAVKLETEDVHVFATRERERRRWDLIVAHAFLDLVNITQVLPDLFTLLRPGGWFYFTINFDGLTVFEPRDDLDNHVIKQYHRTMDERREGGRATAGSRAGRALLLEIPAAGGEIVAAGSSDWIVLPRSGRYPADEAYFLHHIIHFFESSLTGRAAIDAAQLAGWLERRRAQIDTGELVFIAHQIDVCGYISE